MKREFDRKIWRSGNSYVVTIPAETVERFKLEDKFVTITVSDEIESPIKKVKTNRKRKR